MSGEKKSLEERVEAFNMLRLPGQPQFMHMGTSYLVNDLWRELTMLRRLYYGVPVYEVSDDDVVQRLREENVD